MDTVDFDYHLPPELIAQEPLAERDQSRMLVLDRRTGAVDHRSVRDLPEYLQAGDVMVVNDTRVIPARLFGEKTVTGGRVEVLLIEPCAAKSWRALCKASGRTRAGDRYRLASDRIESTVESVAEDGSVVLRLDIKDPPSCPHQSQAQTAGALMAPDPLLMRILEEEGQPPLPPYIRRAGREQDAVDSQRYQTVYARAPGAVAAPTAGLHLTPALFDELDRRGVKRAAITLHVGPGTFKPVTADRIEDHVMDAERYEISQQAAEAIEQARRDGGRVLAVGSTSVRTLEHVAAGHDGRIVAGDGRANLYIRPGFNFQVVNLMLTNFHLPRSTLLMMIAALAGKDRVLDAYRDAVRERYRFYSYGDCMLIR